MSYDPHQFHPPARRGAAGTSVAIGAAAAGAQVRVVDAAEPRWGNATFFGRRAGRGAAAAYAVVRRPVRPVIVNFLEARR